MDKLEKGKRATEKTLEKIGDVPISEIPAEMIERGRAATESLIAKYGHLTVRAINLYQQKAQTKQIIHFCLRYCKSVYYSLNHRLRYSRPDPIHPPHLLHGILHLELLGDAFGGGIVFN